MKAAPANFAPGPRGIWLLGNLLDVRRNRLGFIETVAQEYGDVARFRMGLRDLYLVSGPDQIRHVLQQNAANYRKGVGLAEAKKWLGNGLVTSEGEVWSRQRRLVQAAFTKHQLDGLAPLVTSTTSAMLDRWTASMNRREPVDVASEMMQLTLSVVAKLMFSADVSNATEVGAAFTTALKDAMDQMLAVVALPDWIPFPGKRRFARAIGKLNAIVTQIIRDHRGMTCGQHDLVSTLLAAREGKDAAFDEVEIRDQVMTILLAGHETTASSLAWTFYLLDRNPEVLARMQQEIEGVFGGETPTEESVSRLSYTRMAYQESLRLYPPVWLVPRRSIAADRLGDYEIPPDTDVLISPWVLHHREQTWPEARRFDPDRFLPERAQDRHRYTYLPFGAGPRACVASSFAMMEALLVIVMVVQRFRTRLVPGYKIVPEPLLTLRFRHGIAMTLEPA